MVKFKYINEACKSVAIGVLGNNMCKYGDVIELTIDHLIKKARNNPDYEEVKPKSKKEAVKEGANIDDGQEIRDKAKSLGIKNYWNKKIPSLLEAIKDLEEA